MSRDVEVLRWGLAYSRGEVDAYGPGHPKLNEWQEVLQRAISALEEKEAPPQHAFEGGGEFCLRCASAGQWRLRHEHPETPPKSSSDSMEERIRALTEALEPFARQGLKLRDYHGDQPDRLVQMLITAEQCERAADLLHPHRPWCRGDHSGGGRAVRRAR